MIQINLDNKELSILRELYFYNSKHSFYQPIPTALSHYFPEVKIEKTWRDIRPRVELLKGEISKLTNSETFVEIGSNSGYQLIELAMGYPEHFFIGIEANKNHHEFTEFIVNKMKLKNVLIYNSYVSPDILSKKWPNSIIFDFNVVHHIKNISGDFFENSIENWWQDTISKWLCDIDKFKEYWFSCGYRLEGNLQFELHNPEDPAGFVERILKKVKKDSNLAPQIFAIHNFNKSLYFRNTEIKSLNYEIDSVFKELNLKGEFYKRPIIKWARNIE